jgi:hypothetical protein
VHIVRISTARYASAAKFCVLVACSVHPEQAQTILCSATRILVGTFTHRRTGGVASFLEWTRSVQRQAVAECDPLPRHRQTSAEDASHVLHGWYVSTWSTAMNAARVDCAPERKIDVKRG